MNWMDKLERKLGHYAVPNLSRYFVGAIVLGYLMSMVSSTLRADWFLKTTYILRVRQLQAKV